MILSIDDVYTTVKSASIQQRRQLSSTLAARPDGFMHMPKYKSGIWDGYISLYKSNRFPTGLLDVVLFEFPDAILDDNRHSCAYDYPVLINRYELRQYQQEAVLAALESGNGTLKMATNSGKTLVAAALIKATGYRAIIIVPTRPLLMQTSDDLSLMLDMDIGRYGAGYRDYKPVTVTTMQSMDTLIKNNDLSGNKTMIVDECHHVKAGTLFDNVFNIPGRFRFAMSGTPLNYNLLSDLKLMAAAGDVVYSISNEDLIKADYSAMPIVRFIEINEPDYTGKKLRWADAYKLCITDNDRRNEIIAQIAYKEIYRGPVLIITNWVRHAKNIYIPDSIMATGSDSKDELQDKLHIFGSGKIPIMVCTPIFGEGVNIPDISTIILASGGKSHIQLLQRVGRGLRKGISNELHAYDFLDLTNKFMIEHSNERYGIYKSEGFRMELFNGY